jgi:DNA-directed RNA polymerase subunit RPC12/RpoP
MRCKEVNQNGVTHYYYICDQCGKKFYKEMGLPIYELKSLYGKGRTQYCCYQCKKNAEKEIEKKHEKELNDINCLPLEEQLQYLVDYGYTRLDIACKLNLTLVKVTTLLNKNKIKKHK